MAKQKLKNVGFKINDEIVGFEQVRIIGENINSRVVSLEEAKSIANEMQLDLVEYNSNINPPLLKICNYEKLLYEIKRLDKKNKQVNLPLKEIQLSVNIAFHDIEIKAKQAIGFIEKGDKVKVVLTMRGRELKRLDDSKKSLFEFLALTDSAASVESFKDESNKTIVILKKKK